MRDQRAALGNLLSLTENFTKMRANWKRQEETTSEMEYMGYIRYLWELYGEEFDLSTSYSVRFDHWTYQKNFLVLRRKSDGMEIHYPVRVKYMEYSGATDMRSDKIPERFIELVYQKQRSNSNLGTLRGYQSLRDKRLADEEAFKEKTGHYRSSRPLVGVVKVTASGDEVRLDDVPGDDGVSEMVT